MLNYLSRICFINAHVLLWTYFNLQLWQEVSVFLLALFPILSALLFGWRWKDILFLVDFNEYFWTKFTVRAMSALIFLCDLTSIPRVLLSCFSLSLLRSLLSSQFSWSWPKQCSSSPGPCQTWLICPGHHSLALWRDGDTAGSPCPSALPLPVPLMLILVIPQTWTFLAFKSFHEEVRGVMIICQKILQAAPLLSDNLLTITSFVLKGGLGFNPCFCL